LSRFYIGWFIVLLTNTDIDFPKKLRRGASSSLNNRNYIINGGLLYHMDSATMRASYGRCSELWWYSQLGAAITIDGLVVAETPHQV
jgi:hypothetical protein